MHGFTISLAQENAKFGHHREHRLAGLRRQRKWSWPCPKSVRNKIAAQIPVGRLGEPDEISLRGALSSPMEARWITGANLSINGGQYMGW